MKLLGRALVLQLLLIGVSFCLWSSPAPAQPADVRIINGAFTPADVTAQTVQNEPGFPGPHAHVRFFNLEAGTEHTVTFDDPRLPSSGRLGTSQLHDAVIPLTGTFTYHCSIHPEMRGVATVIPAAASPSGATAEADGGGASGLIVVIVVVALLGVGAGGLGLRRRRPQHR